MSPDGAGALSLSPAPARGLAGQRRRRDGDTLPAARSGRAGKLATRAIALGYLALLLLGPLLMIFYRTFEHGLAPAWDAVTAPNAVHAFWLSLEIVAIAVPLNTAFGIGMALLLERGHFRGKGALGVLID